LEKTDRLGELSPYVYVRREDTPGRTMMFLKYIRYLVRNYFFGVLALIFTIMFWISASRLPGRAIVFPRALLFILIPLFIWNAVSSVRGFRKTLADTDTAEERKWNCALGLNRPRIVVTLATLAYIVLMPILGFITSTVLYLMGLAFYLGIRKPMALTLFAAIYIGIVYAVFGLWLQVRLPTGILI
jgi:putative tricarboxylic transport membrane protein